MDAGRLTTVPNATVTTPNTVAEVYELGREIETGAQRIRRLQHEAHTLAREQVDIFVRDINEMAVRAKEM